MDFLESEKTPSGDPLLQPPPESKANRPRPRSSRRLRYESEVQMIKNRFGSLEDLRAQLGLSRRGVCNLLMVDPSAWTRWTAPGGKAPPHIYRALEWYWYLMQKDPKAVLPIGSWGAQTFGERIQKMESDVERLLQAPELQQFSARARYAHLLAGFGFGILIGALGHFFGTW